MPLEDMRSESGRRKATGELAQGAAGSVGRRRDESGDASASSTAREGVAHRVFGIRREQPTGAGGYSGAFQAGHGRLESVAFLDKALWEVRRDRDCRSVVRRLGSVARHRP
jgi:hypothetical protein